MNTDNKEENDYQKLIVGNSKQLAPIIDRLGRMLVDAAPLVASMALPNESFAMTDKNDYPNDYNVKRYKS